MERSVRFVTCSNDPENMMTNCTMVFQTFVKEIGKPRKDVEIRREICQPTLYVPLPGERFLHRLNRTLAL